MLALVALTGAVRLAAVSDGTGFFALPDTLWPIPGTAVVIAGSDTVRAEPSAYGSRPGLSASPAPEAGDSVLLVFEVAPLRTLSSARLEVPSVGREVEPIQLVRTEEYVPQGLFISGSKRLGISVGDGPGVDQSTRLSLEGSLATGIRVQGSVTDENLPVGAGSSELVSELDRVLLQVDGRRWGVTLGDQEWTRPGTGPLAWSRDVSGATAWADSLEGFGASAGVAVSGRTSERSVFYTQEGVQGPYDISAGGEVVPGSEKVYLDGSLMRRGDTADYTIDYSVGQVTFTSRRLIRRDSRVEALYYGRGAGFRKDSYTAAAASDNGGLHLELTGLSEADDRANPLGFVLSDSAEAVLRNAGEDPDSAWIDGATFVGDGEGSYNIDSLSHFVYAGPGMGGWRVVFSRPPDGRGDYVYDSSLGGFAWVGDGLGTHLPRQYLDIPSSIEVGGVTGSASGDLLSLHFQAAVSKRTGNTFNPGSTTREGTALTGTLGLYPWDGGPDFGVRTTLVTDGFRQPGVWEADSSLGSWSLPPGYEGRDDILEAFGHWGGGSASAGLRIPVGGGRLARARTGFVTSAGPVGLQASASATGRTGTPSMAVGSVFEGDLGGFLHAGAFMPSLGFSFLRDSWADSLSGPQTGLRAGGSVSGSDWTGGLTLEAVLDGRTGPVPVPWHVYRGRIEAQGGRGGLTLSASAEHSSSRWEAGGRSEADAISLIAAAGSGTTWFNAAYSGSGILSSSLEVHYRFVGDGQGSWSFDDGTGQYYPDPDGDYEVYYLPGEGGLLVASASLDASLSAGGIEGEGLDASGRLSAQGSDRLKAFLLAGAFGNGPGGYELEASPFWRSTGGTVRLLRVTGRISKSSVDYSGSGTRDESERSIELLQGLGFGSSAKLDLRERLRRREESLQSDRRIDEARLSADPTLTTGDLGEPGILLGWERRAESFTAVEAYMYEFQPHYRYNGRGWSAWASAGVQLIPGGGVLPLWLFDGNGRGTNLLSQARLSRRLSDQFDLALTWYARRPASGEWTQRAGLEGTVTF